MAYGLTPVGFNQKRFPEVEQELKESTISKFPNIMTTPGSVNGIFISIFSKPISDIWEALAALYHALHPSEAENINLDYIVEYNGLTRLKALPTVTEIILTGSSGTVVPAETTLFKSTVNNSIHKLAEQIELSNTNLKECIITIVEVIADEDYTITVDEHEYIYTAQQGDSIEDVIAGLIKEITDFQESTISAEEYGIGCRLTAKLDGFTIGVTENIIFWNIGIAHSVVLDSIAVTESDITEVETLISGLDSVDNLLPGIPGRKVETDTELRIRREEALTVGGGGGSLDSICAKLLDEVDLVTFVKGYQNQTSEEVDGRPPHSFEIVISGGDETEIAEKIWSLKPAGIQTFGNTEVEITDSVGGLQKVYFSVPEEKYVWLQITLTKYTDDGVYPLNGNAMIKAGIINQGADIGIGIDVIPDKFKSSVFYSSPGIAIPGIAEVIIEAAISDDPEAEPQDFSSDRIIIEENEIALFDNNRIEIIEI